MRENDCLDELQELERKLQERANSVLPNVLGALEQVHSKLKKNIEPSAQQLSSKVKELLDALQSSGLIIQQSPLLPPTLELLRISSTKEQRSLLAPLEQLYYVLELQVDSQSHKEVLSPLQSLFLKCVELQMERSRSISYTPSSTKQDSSLNESSMKLSGHVISLTPSEAGESFSPKITSTAIGEDITDDFFPTMLHSNFEDQGISKSVPSSFSKEVSIEKMKKEGAAQSLPS